MLILSVLWMFRAYLLHVCFDLSSTPLHIRQIVHKRIASVNELIRQIVNLPCGNYRSAVSQVYGPRLEYVDKQFVICRATLSNTQQRAGQFFRIPSECSPIKA